MRPKDLYSGGESKVVEEDDDVPQFWEGGLLRPLRYVQHSLKAYSLVSWTCARGGGVVGKGDGHDIKIILQNRTMGSLTNIAHTQVNCQNTSQNISEPSSKEGVFNGLFHQISKPFSFPSNISLPSLSYKSLHVNQRCLYLELCRMRYAYLTWQK